MAHTTPVPDSDGRYWYQGGFRSVSLPKTYIVDKTARTNPNLANRPTETAWDNLGFFSSNAVMTRYQIARMKDDPEYKAIAGSFHGDSKVGDDEVFAEFADDYSQTRSDPQIARMIVNTFYKKGDDGKTVQIAEADAKDRKNLMNPALVESSGVNIIGHELMSQSVDDTSLGGNDALNCYWSYNEDDDIVHPQTAFNRHLADNKGMNLEGLGRVYSENINRYQQILYLNFGVPVYKGSFSNLFGGSSVKARLINRGNTISADLGNLAGTIFSIALAIPLIPLYGIMALSSLFNDYPVSKYFEHRSAMPMFYKFWNMIAGSLAVNLGLYRATEETIQKIADSLSGTSQKEVTLDNSKRITQDQINTKKQDNSAIPSAPLLYEKTYVGTPAAIKYGCDMLAVMYKRSIRLRQFDKIVHGELPDDRFQSTDTTYKSWLAGTTSDEEERYILKLRDIQDATTKMEAASKSGDTKTTAKLKDKIATLNKEALELQSKTDTLNSALGRWTTKSGWSNLFGMMAGSALQAIDYIGFKVEKSTSFNESYSNTTGPLEIANTLNGRSQAGYEKFSSFWGSVVSGQSGIIGLDQAAQFAGSFLSNIGDTLNMGGNINVITGNGFTDIPERWQSSSFSRSFTVEIPLRARLGDPVSWYTSVGAPLGAILAGSFPRGIGGAMYTSPFLVRGYCKGMFSFPTGIISDVSLSRDTAEFGYNINHLPMAINVNMTIKDLSPILYIGMDNDMNSSMDEYLANLSGLGLYERTFLFPRLLRKLNRAILLKRNTIANPLWWGNTIGNWGVVRLGANFAALTSKPIKNN